MADQSKTSLANLSLQMLGAQLINDITQDHKNADAINACYDFLRRKELRANSWNFARKRKILAPDATAPLFDFNYAFTLPSDYLKIIKPTHNDLDWTIEHHNGAKSILTNDGTTLNLVYIFDVEDVALFDSSFFEALASKVAWHSCEAITQSNTKKKDAKANYEKIMSEAKQENAFEKIPDEIPEDEWVTVRL